MERFWSKVQKGPDCWLWTGAVLSTGYGCFQWHRRLWKAHRVAFTTEIGPIPEGQFVLHHCDNRLCVRPDHLFSGTLADNNRDRAQKGRSSHGERHHSSKLTWAQVEAIRADQRPQRAIAKDYGVTHTTIGQIKRGHLWLNA